MNKLGLVLGVAVVATLAGCKDPNYVRKNGKSQNSVAVVNTTPAPDAPSALPPDVAGEPVVIETVEAHCECLPGTKHPGPCPCAAPDCSCAVMPPPPPPKPVQVGPAVPPPPATTAYIVQSGDTLSKISKKFNIKMDAIRKANPQLKGDVVRVGAKIQLPGNVEVGEQKLPPPPPPKAAAPKAPYKPYEGPTVDYVIKKGDILGSIAHRHGISVRQLKELNSLKSDVAVLGKKIKVPAGKVAVPPPPPPKAGNPADKPATPVTRPVPPPKPETKPAGAVAPDTKKDDVKHCKCAPGTKHTEPCGCGADDCTCVVEAAVEKVAAVEPAAPVAEPASDTFVYVVEEGEDLAAVSIRWSVPPSTIRELNGLGFDDVVKAGDKLKLPAEAQQ